MWGGADGKGAGNCHLAGGLLYSNASDVKTERQGQSFLPTSRSRGRRVFGIASSPDTVATIQMDHPQGNGHLNGGDQYACKAVAQRDRAGHDTGKL